MKRTLLFISFVLTILSGCYNSNINSLESKISALLKSKNATVGVAIQGIENKESLQINGDKHFPMQSVFKFHIALAILNEVDNRKLKLEQEVFINKGDLLPNTWSPIREKYPDGDVKLTLSEIIKYTVAWSDNNGCDILLRMIGGPKEVEKYVKKIGIDDIAISYNEEEMHKNWNAQFSNWTTPKAATDLLVLFYTNKVLADSTTRFLLKTMVETATGKNKIRGQLPEGTIVAHKTGSSGTNDEGITAASNDIGIVTLPNGNHFAVSVFVSNSRETEETNEKIISDIAKTAWAYFQNSTK